jgi:hypothetical protein
MACESIQCFPITMGQPPLEGSIMAKRQYENKIGTIEGIHLLNL